MRAFLHFVTWDDGLLGFRVSGLGCELKVLLGLRVYVGRADTRTGPKTSLEVGS